MNREIKFRAWDGVRMYRVQNMFLSDGAGVYISKSDNHGATRDTDAVMQSTGLKDKNGVDIYEGDIVLWQGTNFNHDRKVGVHATIEFSQGSWRLFTKWDDDPLLYGAGGTLEVVGNTHENSELLNQPA